MTDGRRRLFDQLLMTSLDRAVTLAEMDHIAMLVAEDLDLDMTRLLTVFFDIDFRIAETGLGFGAGRGKGIGQSRRRVDNLHPAPPPPAVALMMTGKPISLATLTASFTSCTPSLVPGRIGTPSLMTA